MPIWEYCVVREQIGYGSYHRSISYATSGGYEDIGNESIDSVLARLGRDGWELTAIDRKLENSGLGPGIIRVGLTQYTLKREQRRLELSPAAQQWLSNITALPPPAPLPSPPPPPSKPIAQAPSPQPKPKDDSISTGGCITLVVIVLIVGAGIFWMANQRPSQPENIGSTRMVGVGSMPEEDPKPSNEEPIAVQAPQGSPSKLQVPLSATPRSWLPQKGDIPYDWTVLSDTGVSNDDFVAGEPADSELRNLLPQWGRVTGNNLQITRNSYFCEEDGIVQLSLAVSLFETPNGADNVHHWFVAHPEQYGITEISSATDPIGDESYVWIRQRNADECSPPRRLQSVAVNFRTSNVWGTAAAYSFENAGIPELQQFAEEWAIYMVTKIEADMVEQ